MLHTCASFGGLPVASHLQVSASLHNLEHFFTLSHSLSLHDSHLNTRLLIAKIQANLARNKANKMVDKIQPYKVVTGKFNLGEKTEDSKVVRKILHSLPESFRAKVTTIEDSKDLDEINVQELIGSHQTHELSLPNQRKRKSLAFKTINERVEGHGSSDEDAVEKNVAYHAKNFRKFLKFKNSEKFGDKGKFMSSGKEKKDFKKREGKESQSTQGVTCFKCNGQGHFKKEFPNYLRSKGKVYATSLSDLDSSTSNSEDSCDEEGNFLTFMTIAHVESSEDLKLLVEELGEHSDEEFMGIVEESNAKEDIILYLRSQENMQGWPRQL